MGAGPKAIPLYEENSEWKKSLSATTFTCQGCNYHGFGYELLCEDDEDTLWCPRCGTAGWAWD